MTLEERLALARGIARRTKPRFVEDYSKREVKMVRFEKVAARTKKLAKRKPKWQSPGSREQSTQQFVVGSASWSTFPEPPLNPQEANQS